MNKTLISAAIVGLTLATPGFHLPHLGSHHHKNNTTNTTVTPVFDSQAPVYHMGGFIDTNTQILNNGTQTTNTTQELVVNGQKVTISIVNGKVVYQGLNSINVTAVVGNGTQGAGIFFDKAAEVFNNMSKLLPANTQDRNETTADDQLFHLPNIFGGHKDHKKNTTTTTPVVDPETPVVDPEAPVFHMGGYTDTNTQTNEDGTQTTNTTQVIEVNGQKVTVTIVDGKVVIDGDNVHTVNVTATVGNGTKGATELFNNLSNLLPIGTADNKFFHLPHFGGKHDKKPVVNQPVEQQEEEQEEQTPETPVDPETPVFHMGGYTDTNTQTNEDGTQSTKTTQVIEVNGQKVTVTIVDGKVVIDGDNVHTVNVTATVGNGTKGAAELFNNLSNLLPIGTVETGAQDNKLFLGF